MSSHRHNFAAEKKEVQTETAHFVVDTENGEDGWEGWAVFEEIEDMYLGVLVFELDDKVLAEALAAEMNAKGFPRSEEFGTWTWTDWFSDWFAAWERMTDGYTLGASKSFEMQAIHTCWPTSSRTRKRFAGSVGFTHKSPLRSKVGSVTVLLIGPRLRSLLLHRQIR